MSTQPSEPHIKMGLRERKKQQTRLALSQVATRLFMERGFDEVTTAEVAEAANVSVNTLFNYFATKEELFFDRAEEVVSAPARVVRERKKGESALEALWRAMRATDSSFFAERVAPFFRTIEGSPALKRRERLLFEESEAMLARTLQEESGAKPGDLKARSAAALIMAAQWMVLQEFRTRMLRGESGAALRKAVSKLAESAYEMLEPALGDYCRK